MSTDDTLGLILCLGLGGFIIMGITQCRVDDSWRKQIAEHGCAEYYLDQNHDRQWRWK